LEGEIKVLAGDGGEGSPVSLRDKARRQRPGPFTKSSRRVSE